MTTEYRAYLASDRWRCVKEHLLVVRCRTCEACGHDGKLWVLDGHHLVYPSPVERTTTNDLLLLCRRCHDIVHDLKIPILFPHGAPNAVRREKTLAEIRRYLPELTPHQAGPIRLRLAQEPRRASVRLPWRGRGRRPNRNQILRDRQAHLPKHRD